MDNAETQAMDTQGANLMNAREAEVAAAGMGDPPTAPEERDDLETQLEAELEEFFEKNEDDEYARQLLQHAKKEPSASISDGGALGIDFAWRPEGALGIDLGWRSPWHRVLMEASAAELQRPDPLETRRAAESAEEPKEGQNAVDMDNTGKPGSATEASPMLTAYRLFCGAARRDGYGFSAASELWKDMHMEYLDLCEMFSGKGAVTAEGRKCGLICGRLDIDIGENMDLSTALLWYVASAMSIYIMLEQPQHGETSLFKMPRFQELATIFTDGETTRVLSTGKKDALRNTQTYTKTFAEAVIDSYRALPKISAERCFGQLSAEEEEQNIQLLFAEPIEDFWEEAGIPEFIVWMKGSRHLRLPPSWPADW
ncbi:unnamed protein product [Symbiodinium sp. CCMP2456]|nr:unnamed protein product [Symbiodinium sp. CCMP2456]